MEEKNVGEIKEAKPPKKKNSGQTIIIIIMILIIVGLVGYICYDKGIIFESEKENTIEKSEIEENKDEEVEINDKLLIKDLSEKVADLNVKSVIADYTVISNPSDSSNKIFNYYFRKDIYENNLTSDTKLDIVLNSLIKEFENLSISYENMETSIQEQFKQYVESGNYAQISNVIEKQVSQKKVEEKYLSLFGEELTNHRTIGICPLFSYDSKNSVYYYSRTCGGTTAGYTYLYKNKFTVKGENAYVYVNLGFSDGENNVYDGYPSYDNNGNSTTKLVEKETDNFTINESNYSKYSEYKYTFKKDTTGNYYFVSLEKNN